jgi:hypoxanthine phosphoribosyltransferase
MNNSKMSWHELEEHVNALEKKIRSSNIRFDWIISINRGGLIIGVMLSHRLKVQHGVLTINNYIGKKKLEKIKRDLYISMVGHFTGNVLIVDEISTSGETIKEAKSFIKKDSDIKIIKTATIHYQNKAVIVPDFYVEEIPHDMWVEYPWERYED